VGIRTWWTARFQGRRTLRGPARASVGQAGDCEDRQAGLGAPRALRKRVCEEPLAGAGVCHGAAHSTRCAWPSLLRLEDLFEGTSVHTLWQEGLQSYLLMMRQRSLSSCVVTRTRLPVEHSHTQWTFTSKWANREQDARQCKHICVASWHCVKGGTA